MQYKKAIYPQLRINIAIFVFTIGIASWQHEFVYDGIMANPYLNCTIIFGMLCGVGLNFYNILRLKNEFIALDALYENLDNVRFKPRGEQQSQRTQARKRLMLNSPARIFRKPVLLKTAHKLLSQEIAQKGNLMIPNATKKLLIEEIEDGIEERIIFANYVAGLMVLIGLMGTFIGLMQTVGSVGAILSGLDFTGGAGVETIQNLIGSLRAPLNGMATGFSSSLFGLAASLMLGMMTKVGGRATRMLKTDFENWLTQVSRITDSPVEEGLGSQGSLIITAGGEEARLMDGDTRLLLRISRLTVAATANMSRQMTNMLEGVESLRREAIEHRGTMVKLTERLDRSLGVQTAILQLFQQNAESDSVTNTRLIESLSRLEKTVSQEAHFSREEQRESLRKFMSAQKLLRESEEGIARLFNRRIDDVENGFEHLSATLRTELSNVREAVDWDSTEAHMMMASLDALLGATQMTPNQVHALRDLSESAGIANDLTDAELDKWISETCGSLNQAKQRKKPAKAVNKRESF